MKTRRLVNNDYSFGKSEQNLCTGIDYVMQTCITKLRQYAGEWFLNASDGTNWNSLLGSRGYIDALKREITRRLMQVDGVLDVASITHVVDDRHVDLAVVIKTAFGKQTINDRITIFGRT